LDDLLATLGAERGATILVEGVPGIGKTALLRCARERATAAGVRTLFASGSEMDSHLAFSGLRQLFFSVLRSGAELSGPAAAAAPALGLGAVAQPPDAAAVAHALRWMLSQMAAAQPTLLVVDDLHWLDPASRQVLAHLCSRTNDDALGFVLATRPDEATELDFAQALRDADCRELHPAPLSADAVGQLLAGAVAGTDVAPAFVAACVEITGGIPFLVNELLREVHARRLPPDGSGAEVVRGLAPRTIQRHVLARLARLPDAARRLANAVAILPPGADLTLAADVAQIAEAECAPAVRALVGAYVLRDRPLDFVHPVMRAVVVSTLSSVEVSAAHRRAAVALRCRNASASDIALHLLCAAPCGSAADADTLAAAGVAAAAAGAPDTAVEYLQRALIEPPAPAEQPAVLAALGEALAATGNGEAVTVLQAAFDSTSDIGARAEIAIHLAEALAGDVNRPDHAVRLLQRAAEELPLDDDRRLALLARLMVFANRGFQLDIQTWCSTEMPLGLAGTTPAQRACMVMQAFGTSREDPRTLLLAATRHPDFVSDELPGSVTVGWAIMGLRAIGELTLALQVAQQAVAHAEGWGRPGNVARRLAQVALMQCRLGRIAEAVSTFDRAITLLDGTMAGGDRLWIGSARVRVALAAGLLETAADAARALPEGADGYPWANAARAELAAACGDFACAVELFPRPQSQRLALDPSQIDPLPRGAIWLASVGRVAEARELLSFVEPHVEHFNSPSTRGQLFVARGVVERDADMTRAGVELLAGTEFRLAYAESLVDLGMLLRRKGTLREARIALREGLEQAQAIGAGLLIRTATSELAIAGARRVSRTSVGPAALTTSELRVAHRAVTGATNAQIAEALFLNVKTVEMHLANAYRKLGIAGRARLPDALAAVGMADVGSEPMTAGADCEPAS
jgi:DNA-binding CsgD family transcriptional regulator